MTSIYTEDAERPVRVEETAPEGEQAPEQAEQAQAEGPVREEVVPPYIQRVLDNQARLEGQQQSLKRQLERAARRGEAPNTVLLKTIANVEQLLTVNEIEQQIKNLDLTEEQAAAFRKLRTDKPKTDSEPSWTDESVLAWSEQHFEEVILPDLHEQAALAGLVLPPEAEDEIRADFRVFEVDPDPRTGMPRNIHEFVRYERQRLALSAEKLQAKPAAPARTAGRALGDGGRPAGSPAGKLTWEQGYALAQKGKLSDKDLQALVAQG